MIILCSMIKRRYGSNIEAFVVILRLAHLQVRPIHVKEACRLLNKSIIRVEQPDIHLEQDEEEEMAMGEGACSLVEGSS